MTALLIFLALVPIITLALYWSVMHVDKLQHQGLASPQAVWIARWLVLPVGALCNLVVAWTWAPLLFLTWPREAGLTKFINRQVARGGWRAAFGLHIRRTYLNHYDYRGEHT